MILQGVEFDPRELQTIAIALDIYEADNDDHADSIDPESSDEHDAQAIKSYRAEAAMARAAKQKWVAMLSNFLRANHG